MTDPAIATAADYADALLTARRAKNLLVLLVVLMLLIQLAVFFVVKYTGIVYPMNGSDAPATAPTTGDRADLWHSVAQYAVGTSVFIGVAGTVLAALMLYLITQIMVVGRLIGVSRVISALVWTFVVLLLIFPWQAFLADQTFKTRDWILPGVLYSWDELIRNVRLGADAPLSRQVLHWARFVAWPVIAIVMLLAIQVKSNRGLRQALGEESITTDFETPTTPKPL